MSRKHVYQPNPRIRIKAMYDSEPGPVDHFRSYQEPPTVDSGGKFDDGIAERTPLPREHLQGARPRKR